ncbi:hypothetical protein SAMN05216573_10924 [Bradyrhizobium sp. Rc3b]|nr:hypothetical protein SAMN05216573_10924 [Bradyrhizobium sp. Rc3b]
MSNLLERADEAIAESRRLQRQNQSLIAESRYWFQHLYWSLERVKVHPQSSPERTE